MTGKFKIETESATWKAVVAWIEQRLEVNRGNLEICGLPDDETENCRGAIVELQELRHFGRTKQRDAPVVVSVDGLG